MARRSKDIRIQEAGRDQGKLFRIMEMSALDTEKWATRSINAILRNAAPHEVQTLLPLVYSYMRQMNEAKDLPEVIKEAEQGKATILNSTEALAIYFAGMFFGLPFEDLQQVSDPLLNCCAIYLTPGQGEMTEPVLNNPGQYIEEASTFYILKLEAFRLHTDFFMKGVLQYLNRYTADAVSTDSQGFGTRQTSHHP